MRAHFDPRDPRDPCVRVYLQFILLCGAQTKCFPSSIKGGRLLFSATRFGGTIRVTKQKTCSPLDYSSYAEANANDYVHSFFYDLDAMATNYVA